MNRDSFRCVLQVHMLMDVDMGRTRHTHETHGCILPHGGDGAHVRLNTLTDPAAIMDHVKGVKH